MHGWGVYRAVFTSDDPRTKEARQLADTALRDLQKAGATLVDPVAIAGDLKTLLLTSGIGAAELREGIDGYLARLGPDAPIRNLAGLIRDGGIIYNKFASYQTAVDSGPIEKYPKYAELVGHRGELRAQLLKLLDDQKLDAIVYLHNLYAAEYINEPHPYTKVTLSSVSGLPGLVVPAGFTSMNQPVGIEFLGACLQRGPRCCAWPTPMSRRPNTASSRPPPRRWRETLSPKIHENPTSLVCAFRFLRARRISDGGAAGPGGRVRPPDGHHRGHQQGLRRRRPDLGKTGAALPEPDRGLRQKGAAHQCGHHAEHPRD